MTPRRATVENGQTPQPLIDGLITSGLPRDHFPADGADPDTVCDVLTEELLLDGNNKQNLATFCQTWESPQVHRLMDLAIDKNLIDKDEYPQTAEIEQRCIALLADLWHAPGQPVGCSTVGSSEAAMLGGITAKWRWRARRKAAGKPADLVFHVSYLGGDMPTFQINFSRPAGQVIAQYFDFVWLGRAGYTTIHEESHAVAQYCAGEIGRLDGFEIVHDGDPKRGIPTVVWTLAEGVAKPYTLYDLADRLRMRGWQVPA